MYLISSNLRASVTLDMKHAIKHFFMKMLSVAVNTQYTRIKM